MNKLAAILIVGLLTAPALAWPPNPAYMAGDFNGWNPAGDVMTETFAGSGVWQKSFVFGASERHEFKITNGTWDENYPLSGNSWLLADGSGNVTVTYDSTAHGDGWAPDFDRIGLSFDPADWTAVGDWQGWNNANPATHMTAMGGGIYRFEAVVDPGTHYYKAVRTGTWDAIGTDSRGVNSNTWEFTTDATNNIAVMWVNALAGAVKVDILPEPATLGLLLLGGLALLRRR